MNKTAYKTSEKESNSLVLVVDRIGVIGEALAQEFSKDFFVVFVTKRPLAKKNGKISQVLFKGKIPKVPHGKYIKIFVVDDGDSITRESSFSFIEKAKQINSEFYFLGSLRNFDIEHAGEVAKSFDLAKVLIFGDLFDRDILFDKETSITKFIQAARKNKKLKVSGSGLSLNYPITFDDTIKLVVRAAYIKIPQKIILLFYQHPITDISLAHAFQKIDPDIEVDFSSEQKEKKIYLPVGSQYALTKYDLKKKLEEVGLERNKEEEINSKRSKKIDLKYFKLAGFFLLACLFLFLLPLITTTSYLFLGYKQIESAGHLAEKGDYEKALKKSENAQTFFNIADKTSIPLDSQSRVMRMQDKVKEVDQKIESGKSVSAATSKLMSGTLHLKKIFDGKSTDSEGDLESGIESLKNSYVIIQKAKAQKEIPKDIESKFESLLPMIDLLSNTSDVTTRLLGFDSEKTYLVLFQNSLELRPGGGVVDGAAQLSIKNGKVSEFEIVDTKSIDQTLKIHVEPEYPIRRYLPAQKLLLRDSNFNPDFVDSAIKAASIYKLETKKEVDGVIGVDLYFLSNLLKATGPVMVEEYGSTVDSENLLKVVYEESEKNILPSLVKSIEKKISDKKEKPYLSIFESVGNSISGKHLIFALKDSDVQNIFSATNLSGSLSDSRKNNQNEINDYFGISEANLGLNKVNYFISRSVSKKVIIGERGQMDSIATIAFKNNSQKENPLAKDYKSYLQLILPKDSKIQEISIGGKIENMVPAVTDYLVYERRGYVPSGNLEIEQRTQGDKSIFGFPVNVPVGSVVAIKVSYSTPFKILNSDETTKYSLLIYKQLGIDSYPFDLIFDASDNYSYFPKDSYSGEVRRDQELKFGISQK